MTGGPTATAAPDVADRRVPSNVAALGYRDYRWFWTASIVSNTGSLMHMAALNWVVADLHGVTTATVIASIGVVPMLISSPIGGSLADRFERRRVFLWTVCLQTLTAAAVAIAYSAGWTGVATFATLAVVGGFTGSIGAPVQQAIVTDLVPATAMRNASVLNSTQFTVSRSLGPTIAGLMIAPFGAATVFWANTISFVALIVALQVMSRRPAPARSPGRRQPVAEFVDGVRYVRASPGLRMSMAGGFVLAFASSPLQLNGQVIAKKAFDAGPTAFGLLVGAFGYGSLAGAIGLLVFDKGWTHRRILGVAAPVFAVGLGGLAISPVVALGIVANAVIGVAFMLSMSTILSATHALCADAFRGRVMSVWMIVWGVAAPLGIALSALASSIGIRWVMAIYALVVAAFFGLAALRGRIRHLDP